MLVTGKTLVAFAGKTGVYFKPITSVVSSKGSCEGSKEEVGQVPDIILAEELKEKDSHIECFVLSEDEKVVAVADSLHALRIFKLEGPGSGGDKLEWKEVFSGKTAKRVVKLHFTEDGKYLSYSDKQGDIFSIRLDPTSISQAKKIMGHTSFISDFAVQIQSPSRIISCDRDEKIRISNFPDAFEIQGFLLGHTESVLTFGLVKMESKQCLLSVSVVGALILWDVSEPCSGAVTKTVKKWDLKPLLPESLKEAEVIGMKFCQEKENVYLCASCSGSSKALVFKMNLASLTLELVHELETGSDLHFIQWIASEKPAILVYSPQSASFSYLQLDGVEKSLIQSPLKLEESIVSDIKASAEYLKPAPVPMKKRQTTFDDVKESDHEKKIKIDEFFNASIELNS